MLRRIATALTVLIATAGVTACGSKQDVSTKAETEGEYITVGGLKYQVQISRALNPANIEDKDYLSGLSALDATIRGDQVWFAIFIRAEYDKKSGGPLPTATEFELHDTQENVYTPVQAPNPYAYKPSTLEPTQLNPAVDSGASEGPTQGALLLFKLPEANLANRPLELVIANPSGKGEGTVEIDV